MCISWKFLLLIYSIIAFIIIPLIGTQLPYSIFCRSSPEKDNQDNIRDNNLRIENARRTLTKFKLNHHQKALTGLPDYCFVIVTVRRPRDLFFLTQVVAGLLPQIVGTNSVYAIYNAEGPPHTEAVDLAPYIPVITNNNTRTRDRYSMEKVDYVSSLQWCYEQRAKYAVVIQDDAIPAIDFKSRLDYIMSHHMRTHNGNWAFLKLFYPPKWQGWSEERVMELFLTCVLGTLVLTGLSFLCHIWTRAKISKFQILFRLSLSCGLWLYILLTLSRPHWLVFLGKLQLNFVVPAPGCCIPAVLYPQQHLGELIKYLKSVTCSHVFPVDLALDKFADSSGLKRLLVEPDLVQHIGFVSSLGKLKEPHEFRF